MSVDWNTSEFVRRMDFGEFNGHLSETLAGLSHAQLLEVCQVLAERNRKTQARPRDGAERGGDHG